MRSPTVRLAIASLVTAAALTGCASGEANSDSSCSRGPQVGADVVKLDVTEDLVPVLNGTDAEISAAHQADDGTIHIGLHPPVTEADLCAVADHVSDQLDLPVVVEVKAVESVTS
ncbi:hypothetical protein [Promicromonospora iranensis]|uniref:BON domain-containing protein n=1 Tax=Promicromonospora iranensis TaxID=1105144 RepID=A0ABU2CH41_9MICO|nr:hypothetical protein [Promicromonospora iranensis]MDR7380507.1 hypothetical protein [Promicromonospora iranensis]